LVFICFTFIRNSGRVPITAVRRTYYTFRFEYARTQTYRCDRRINRYQVLFPRADPIESTSRRHLLQGRMADTCIERNKQFFNRKSKSTWSKIDRVCFEKIHCTEIIHAVLCGSIFDIFANGVTRTYRNT